MSTIISRGVEQRSARQGHNLKVAGSNPAPASIDAPWWDRDASDLAAGAALFLIFLFLLVVLP